MGDFLRYTTKETTTTTSEPSKSHRRIHKRDPMAQCSLAAFSDEKQEQENKEEEEEEFSFLF
jgi:hypothetical protein